MTSAERREAIQKALRLGAQPVSATALAKQFHVSRQIIVGDIALLRAANVDILATPRGYILQDGRAGGDNTYTIACRHREDQLLQELYIVVDNGGGLIDVIVEHPLYGQISGPLRVFSRYDADMFQKKLLEHRANPLSALTDGVHLHTISCPSQETYKRILEQLEQEHILLPK